MKPARFSYHRPETVEQTLALLAEHGEEAQILAGGQSLVPMLNLRMAAPTALVDINRVPGLDCIEETGDGLVVGACVRQAAVLRHAESYGSWPLLAQAIPHVAHPGIRNRGTLCGSIALADPAAEAPACAIALDARIRLASASGSREVPAAEFFQGIFATSRAPEELIVSILFPHPGPDWRFAFREVARRRGDYAMAGLCAAVRLDGSRIVDARLVFFGIGEAPVRAGRAEKLLVGRGLSDPGARRSAADSAQMELPALPSPDCSAAYKRRLAGVLVSRALADLDAEEICP